ncbi:DnaJ-domain-containing protein [Coprinopsis marcescibilis]|uniref:DnaJ-domain-containing protein n=1 Tax=Coprinopsis marcescibilis TaxID=230819 RepID=A0A5C3L4T2_COPMA|nr:DnaJ-domain-containing protein [Coprinopsis marcescibilis]
MSRRSPHQLLGVPDYATTDEIKHAYRALVLHWHPDRHENDKGNAAKRYAEINRAYKDLTRCLDLESNFEEPIVMSSERGRKPSYAPPSKRLSSSSSTSSSSSSDRWETSTNSRVSISPTTPSSSFKESPTTSGWPKPPFVSSPYRPEHRATPAYDTWRGGSDLPEASKYHPYHPSHSSHPKPSVTGSSKPPRRAPTPAHPHQTHARPGAPNSSQSPVQRPAISVVVPQNITSARHPASEKQYVNVFGQVATQPCQPSHSAPYELPLISIGLGPTGEWTYSLPLTLEDLFSGVHIDFPIVRRLLSGRARTVTLELDIPAGCRPTSRLCCRRVGHEIQPGVLQDIAFIIEQKPHARFTRLEELRDDLVLDVQVPWTDSMRQYGTEASFVGIDGQALSVFIDYPRNKATKGRNVVKGAGMPIRHGNQIAGRGDLIVQWEIVGEQTNIMHFVKRLWKK